MKSIYEIEFEQMWAEAMVMPAPPQVGPNPQPLQAGVVAGTATPVAGSAMPAPPSVGPPSQQQPATQGVARPEQLKPLLQQAWGIISKLPNNRDILPVFHQLLTKIGYGNVTVNGKPYTKPIVYATPRRSAAA